MKNILRIFITISLVMFLDTSGYAQNNNEDKLIGTWALDYNKTINNMKQEAKQHYDGMATNRKQSLQASFSQRKMTFEADGTYTLVVNSGRQVTGTWHLKQDGTALELVTNGRAITHTIGSISNQNLELLLEKNEGVKQLLGTWYLDKTSN